MEFDTIVYEESRQGASIDTIQHATQDAHFVVSLISKMDGKKVSSISLFRLDENLHIGGGNDGRYSVTYYHDASKEYSALQNPGVRGCSPVEIVIEGFQRLVDPRSCVNWNAAARAAIHFVANGGKAEKLTWDVRR